VVARRYLWLRESLDFFSIMRVLDFDETAAEQFGQLRQLRLRVGTQDLRIAAIALTTDSIVITRNKRDFSRVPGLQIEDWSRE
jgi:tRNA(fMet)-specific endonuclease VapC